MTKRELLQTLTDEEFYDAMVYVVTELSHNFTDSRLGIIEWLRSDHHGGNPFKFKIGDRVEFVDPNGDHERSPNFYPAPGTIGKVVCMDPESDLPYLVVWPEWANDEHHEWSADEFSMKLVKEGDV